MTPFTDTTVVKENGDKVRTILGMTSNGPHILTTFPVTLDKNVMRMLDARVKKTGFTRDSIIRSALAAVLLKEKAAERGLEMVIG